MKKTFLFLLAVIMSVSLGYAQQIDKRKVQAVEAEIAVGTGIGMYKLGFDQNRLMLIGRGEVRYNFPSGAFDLGLGAQITRMERASLSVTPSRYDVFPSWQLYVVGDYNWQTSNNLSLFAGLAAGVSRWTQASGNATSVVPDKWSPYIAPRVGLEAWNRLRVTVSANIMNKETSFMGLSLGYAFGGKPLK